MKKEKFSLDRLKKMPKNQLFIGALAGILLLVVAIPVEDREKKRQEQEAQQVQTGQETSYGSSGDYGKRLERSLEQTLEKMAGVGKVKVMITLQDEGELVVEKDRAQSSKNSTEEDGTVKRTTGEGQSQEETVYTQDSGGGPFIKKEVTPRVEGVLVVAEGGGDAKTVKNISDAVLALFSVEAHKIKVVKMN